MITNHFSHISHSLYRQTGNLPFLIQCIVIKTARVSFNLIRHSLQSVDITSRKFTFIKSRDTSSSPFFSGIDVTCVKIVQINRDLLRRKKKTSVMNITL